MLVAQNSLGPVCPVPLTVRGTFNVRDAHRRVRALVGLLLGGLVAYVCDRSEAVEVQRHQALVDVNIAAAEVAAAPLHLWQRCNSSIQLKHASQACKSNMQSSMQDKHASQP